MKKTLILLSGITNCGKTAVLRNVISLIDSKYKNNMKVTDFKLTHSLIRCSNDKEMVELFKAYDNISLKDRLSEIAERDVAVIIEINNIKIGIATAGDTQKLIHAYLALFTKYSCDIIISASKSSGETVKEYHSFIDKNPNIEIYPMYKIPCNKEENTENCQSKHNEIMSNQIFKILKAVMENKLE